MDTYYYKKYIKYKQKYIFLKINKSVGGKKLTNNIEENNVKTYVIIADKNSLDFEELRKILKDWRELSIDETKKEGYVDFMLTFKHSITPYDVKCKLKSMLNDDRSVIGNKYNLYTNMLKQFPAITQKHLMKTHNIKDVTSINEQIMIIRPVKKYLGGGKDIEIVTSNKEFQNVKFDLLKKYDTVIISEYLTNPLLFEDRKFHIRAYMIVVSQPYKYKLIKSGKILTAKDNYKNNDWHNKNIHDTHVKSTPKNLYFPDDLKLQKNELDLIMSQMQKIADCIGTILRGHANPFPESDVGFTILGLDFMITTDYVVKLLEVNADEVGFACVGDIIDQKYSDFSQKIFKNIYKYAIRPTFG